MLARTTTTQAVTFRHVNSFRTIAATAAAAAASSPVALASTVSSFPIQTMSHHGRHLHGTISHPPSTGPLELYPSHWKLQALRGGGDPSTQSHPPQRRLFFLASHSSSTQDDDNVNKEKILNDGDDDDSSVVTKATEATSSKESSSASLEDDKPNLRKTKKKRNSKWGKAARQAIGNVISGTGFVTSSIVSLVTDRRSFQDRFIEPIRALQNYLQQSGVDLELTPHLNRRLGMNLCLLGRVHMHLAKQQQQQEEAQPNEHKHTSYSRKSKTDATFWTEARRYMRYATAVYGQSMIHAAEVDARGNFPSTIAFGSVAKDTISKHISVPADDIVVMDVDYDGDGEHLRHMVVVDHAHQKVVLSIRGTFSLGEIVIDAAAFSREFCGGEAHSEMATMAERVWSKAGPTVKQMLQENDKYELIVTGHSLGAGAACLLMILLETKKLLPTHQRKRCFAYAAPPVFTPLEFVPQTVKATTNFVHQNDVIPFLSVHSVRQLFQQIRAVSEVSQQDMTRRERYKVLLGMQPPPPQLTASVLEATGTTITPKRGAPTLSIPAQQIVWLKQQQPQRQKAKSLEDDSDDDDMVEDYEFEVYHPNEMKKYGIRVNPDMLLDHFPPRYEHAFDHLKEGK